ncbi:TRAP transporter large permease subunit [Microbacterium sp. zg.B48]|uniref:TRAP transporter large permease n=1 Tax=Microbacterium sp. zg.B48 TaxID=2969408 RepID=UPI00214ADEDA|nr:TRAP transporter large permease subunit [Microbacterium sp. zg.B48]MCR2764354.1 TRAP transporter large permease subunit [Microbacterium sp. zg.B48]
MTVAAEHAGVAPGVTAGPARPRFAFWVWLGVSVIILGGLLTVPMPRELSGTIVICLMLTLMMTGVPIAFAMIGAASVGLWKLGGFQVLATTIGELAYTGSAKWSLSVIPMFVFMGIALWHSGVAERAFVAARQWLGRLPGGLALGTNFAGAGLAAASGSSVSISYALGRIALPEMMRAGYSPRLATGAVAMAGTLGQLIPPSILLVIYAGIVQVPVGPQLLAAVVPGILIAVAFGVVIVFRSALNPSLAPPVEMTGVTWKTRWQSLLGVVPAALVVLVVLGGLFSGVFTPTEAGAFGALTAVLAGWLSTKDGRSLRNLWRIVKDSAMGTVPTVAGLFLLLTAIDVLARMMSMSRATHLLIGFVMDSNLSKVAFLFLLILIYLVLGTFLEPLAMMLITLPILTPALLAYEVDLLWFGVFAVILAEIAIVSPPVGLLVFVVNQLMSDPKINMGRKSTMNDVYIGVLWFIAAMLILLTLFILFPEIVTWLPHLQYG